MSGIWLTVALVLNALASAGVGVWAAGATPWWLVTPIWMAAVGGWFALAIESRGLLSVGRRAHIVATVAALCSALLALLSGGPLVAIAGVAVNVLLLRWWSRWRAKVVDVPQPPARRFVRARQLAAFGFASYALVVIAARPWYSTWGTSRAERLQLLPGDSVMGLDARYRIDHGVRIDAPRELVWAFLAQIGQDRAGFYSYDGLERAIGAHIVNVDTIVPVWGDRRVGDLVRAVQPGYLGGILGESGGWRIDQFDPPSVMVLRNWGSFVVVPSLDGTTRLIARTRGDGSPTLATVPLTPFGLLLFEPAHFIMQRRMLLGIKECAERAALAQAGQH